MKGFKDYLSAAELAQTTVQVGDKIKFDVDGMRLIEGVVTNTTTRRTIVEITQDTSPTTSPINGNSGTQKETYKITKDGKLRSAGQEIDVHPGDSIIIYIDPRIQSWDEVIVKRRDGATIRNIDCEDPGFKAVFQSVEDINEDMLFILYKKGQRRLEEIRATPEKQKNEWKATIWSDHVLTEETREKFHDHQAAVIPAAWVFPDLSNNFYAMYRFGVSMAMSPLNTSKIPSTSVLGNDLMTVGYTEEEREIIMKSAQAMGIKSIQVTDKQSKEPKDTNTQSPVQPKGPIRRKN